MEATIYSDGTYLRNNPGWHADDSAWKAGHVASMLGEHGLAPRACARMGCGSGEDPGASSPSGLPAGPRYAGYDISPMRTRSARASPAGALEFRLADLLTDEVSFDVALAMESSSTSRTTSDSCGA
jgi:hypothetical protein